MKLSKKGSTSFITAMFLASAFIVLVSYIWSEPLQSLERLLFVSSLTQEHSQTCQAALRPVDCVSKVTIPR